MTNGKPRENGKQDELDRMLDAALAKYAAAAPRAGLEERVLANLRAEQARVPDRAWWGWSVIAAVAAVTVVALVLTWRSGKESRPVVANRPVVATQPPKEPASPRRSGFRPAGPRTARKVAMRLSPLTVASARPPKLDQFPSPQPLSEQELALRRYVSEFPEEATLIARAQEEYAKEIREGMKDARSETELFNSDQQER